MQNYELNVDVVENGYVLTARQYGQDPRGLVFRTVQELTQFLHGYLPQPSGAPQQVSALKAVLSNIITDEDTDA